jgi:hypothetical protein
MIRLGSAAGRIRLAAMIALGAFAVHQLRYSLAFGDASAGRLAERGHGYLETLVPGLAVLGLAVLAATALRALSGGGTRRTPILVRALACAVALLCIFTVQELLEWVLSSGQGPDLLALLFGAGAWIALPLSALFGLAVSLLLGGLEGIERAVASALAPAPRLRPERSRGRPRRARGGPSLGAPLAFGLARRPPPPAA